MTFDGQRLPNVAGSECPNCRHFHQRGAVCDARYATDNGTPWRPCPCIERRRMPRATPPGPPDAPHREYPEPMA